MPNEKDWFKAITGVSWEEATRTPPFETTEERQWKEINTHFPPLRVLGYTSADDELLISEEERESHMHLIGSTGEGKSRFLQHLIQGDIDKGLGACLLDPSAHGETVYSVLRYCAKVGFEKVCLIDPHHRWKFNVVAGINPFNFKPQHRKASIDSIRDTAMVLFGNKDLSEINRINRYLSAVLNVLWQAQARVAHSKAFMLPVYAQQRQEILSYSPPMDEHRLTIEEAFRDKKVYENYQTTVGRIKPFQDDVLGLMLSTDKGIDFVKMVREGWVILVNASVAGGVNMLDSRLIGTLVINQITSAIDILKENHWKGIYYLYIDEAGRFANRKLAELLTERRKSGLRITIGHQYFGQFEDNYVRDAVLNLTKIKAMFNVPGRDDRDTITKMFYGGDISDRDASYANADLPKQTAVVKVAKGKPQRVRIPNVPDINIPEKRLEDFISKIYQQEWIYPADYIERELKKKFPDEPTRGDTNNTRHRAEDDRTSTKQNTRPRSSASSEKWKVVPEDLPGREQPPPKDGKAKPKASKSKSKN
ncbi:MAG: type IV secretory system conjugative DNA transfer family protein [Acidobacteriota bacterium]|nr:type IV secretory system conjugative DNA transfer family protein [Acidobacteriota bacterium]